MGEKVRNIEIKGRVREREEGRKISLNVLDRKKQECL